MADRPRRLALLVGGLDRGGSERQLCLFLNHLDHRRWRPTVISLNSGQDALAGEVMATAAELVPLGDDARRPLARCRRLAAELRRREIEVVHSWSFFANGWAALAGRLAAVPGRIGSLRGSLGAANVRDLPRPWRRLCLRGVDPLVVNAASTVAELRATGLGAERIAFLPNALDPALLTTPPSAAVAEAYDGLGLDPETPVVVSVGNLRAVKNHAMLLRALAKVIDRQPAARGLIVGGADDDEPGVAAETERLVADLGLSRRVVLAGRRDDVATLLHGARVFCLSSRSEGSPNAVLEAMAAGLPVVATHVGGVADLVDPASGILVASDDDEAMADALSRLLADPSEARRRGAAGARRARQRHAAGVVAGRLEALYARAHPP